jgi:hypothetical protein
VSIFQPCDARPQKSDCHTQAMDKTDHFVVIESGVVGKFRDSKDGEDVIQGGSFNA